MTQARTQPIATNHNSPSSYPPQTLLAHLNELRARLLWIVLFLVFTAASSYLIQDQIMSALMRPLNGQRLVYLTPIGGFNFLFKVSLYFGIGLVLPVIIYHLYRFLEPIMDKQRKRSVVLYIMASFLLAIGGASFAYFASLPAAMHFLTGFNIQNVSAMLTVDSYLSFVITYVLGFAILFQIPLVLLIINTIRPIPPRKLMGFQRYVILIAFILAAIISPTPDVTNQAILAVPIIAMYQIGVFIIWLQSISSRKKPKSSPLAAPPAPYYQPAIAPVFQPAINSTPARAPLASAASVAARPKPILDITRSTNRSSSQVQPRQQQNTAYRKPVAAPRPMTLPPTRRNTTIDGFIRRASPTSLVN